MTRVVRNAALACAAGILVASAALANVPDPSQTTRTNNTGPTAKNDVIAVEGKLSAASSTPDSCEIVVSPNVTRCAKYTVVVKDFAGNLIPGSQVTVDFSGCPDISISCNQLTATTGQTVAAGKKVSGVTNAVGSFTFQVQGAANSTTLPSGVTSAGTLGASGGAGGTACAQLYADGVPIIGLRVSAFDSNGANGSLGNNKVTGPDAATYAKEVANCLAAGANCRQRTDVTQDGFVQGGDSSREAIMVTDALNNTGSGDTGTYCP